MPDLQTALSAALKRACIAVPRFRPPQIFKSSVEMPGWSRLPTLDDVLFGRRLARDLATPEVYPEGAFSLVPELPTAKDRPPREYPPRSIVKRKTLRTVYGSGARYALNLEDHQSLK